VAQTPLRETILEYIRETTLAAINGSGEYNYTAKTITRRIQEPQEFDVSQLPALVIRDDIPTQYQHMTGDQYETGSDIGKLDDGMQVNIIGIVSTEVNPDNIDTGLISEGANKILRDIIEAMMSDTTLGGNCEAVVLVASLNMLDWGAYEGRAVTSVRFSINYLFNPATPVI